MYHHSYSPESAGKPSTSLRPANNDAVSRKRPSSSYAVRIKAHSEHCYPACDSERDQHHSVRTPTRSTSLRHPRYEMAPLILDEFKTTTRRRLHADRLKPWTVKHSNEPKPTTHSNQRPPVPETNDAQEALARESQEQSPGHTSVGDGEGNDEQDSIGQSSSQMRPTDETKASAEQRKAEWERIRAALQTNSDDETREDSPTPGPNRVAHQGPLGTSRVWRHSGSNFFPAGVKGLHQDQVVEMVLEEQRRLRRLADPRGTGP
ncbi:MAG: hypothetical protein Q9187_002913 [Circinaria calcarea]